MIDAKMKRTQEEQKDRVRRRIRKQVDMDNYEFFPAQEQVDYYDNDIPRRVAVYARVSTGSIQQTSSYELQKKYYEDFVLHHPNWSLVRIYADEGISGTSLAKRAEFNQMIAHCKQGDIDIIVTKSVSRFARNVVDCISMVRTLAELPHPVGVFFESECIFSLKDDSQLALSFQATMAQEESHIRSRSMETSLRMRLDGGLPLTPKLLGYSHDADGNLVINPTEAPTVKLIFFMYLYGYSTAYIAETLTELGRKTYLGNIRWTANSITQVLRNERHCGDVLTRKTFTPNYLTHKSKKNRGNRPQSVYRNHHDAIVRRDDFIAVQQLLSNAKYGNKSILPELRAIDCGLLRGFIRVNPRWAGFKASDYYRAAAGLVTQRNVQDEAGKSIEDAHITISAGEFDMRGFEIARSGMFDSCTRPSMIFHDKKIKFSSTCVRGFGKNNQVELLVNPTDKLFAVRTAPKDSRYSVTCSKVVNGIYYPKEIPATAYMDTIYQIFGWNINFKYRISGQLYEKDGEFVYLFSVADGEAFIKPSLLEETADDQDATSATEPLSVLGTKVRAVPKTWTDSFGNPYYVQRHADLSALDEERWSLPTQGQIVETGDKLQVTDRNEMRAYIDSQLWEKEDIDGSLSYKSR